MRAISRLLAAAAMTAGVMLAAAPVSAATINTSLTAPSGPYNLGNPVGHIPLQYPLGLLVLPGNTYNITFSLSPGVYNVLAEMTQYGAASNNFGFMPINFYLYSGTPTGPNSLLGSSGSALNAQLATTLATGAYYLQIRPADIAGRDMLVKGGITLTSVPEPATWAMLISGFGLLGLAARRRRTQASALA
jgi:hypothetical protein